MHFRLAIIVINYRTPELTLDCLATLPDEIDPGRDVVVVVDNASPDNSAEILGREIVGRGWERWARLLRAEHNGGFAAGNNAGIRDVSAECYLLLNSDTLVRPGAIRLLLQAAQTHLVAGLFGPRLESPDGSRQDSCFRNRSPLGELVESAGTGPVTRLLAPFDVVQPPSQSDVPPQWLSFACVLIRREVFCQIGLLDTGYFMYFEDIDFCRRAREAGWQLVHCPEARVVHLGGASSRVEEGRAARRRLPRYYYESRCRYFARFYGRSGLLLANLLRLTGRGIALSRELVGNKRPHACQRESWDIWSGFWKPAGPAPAEIPWAEA